MELSDGTKIFILFGIIGVLIWFFIQSNSDDAKPNEGSLTQNLTDAEEDENVQTIGPDDVVECDADEVCDDKALAKFRSRNSAPCGQFAYSSYADAKRGGRASDLDKFFEANHPLDKASGFGPSDDDGRDNHARYVGGKCRKKMRDIDKYNIDEMLPREENKDWFDNPYEGAAVKNQHLINIYKPIGVNSLGSSLKNPSHDLRGDGTFNPKTAVSPWNNSSIEPDTNIRGQALCN